MGLIPVPALVDEGVFEAVQNQLQENRQRARQAKAALGICYKDCWFAPSAAMPITGRPLARRQRKAKNEIMRTIAVLAPMPFALVERRICDNCQVRTDLLEQRVWEEVCDLLQDQQRLQQEYERRLNIPKKETENLAVIHAQQGKIQQGMARLIDGYAEGFVQKAEFEPRITRLRQRYLSWSNKPKKSRIRKPTGRTPNRHQPVRRIWRKGERQSYRGRLADAT